MNQYSRKIGSILTKLKQLELITNQVALDNLEYLELRNLSVNVNDTINRCGSQKKSRNRKWEPYEDKIVREVYHRFGKIYSQSFIAMYIYETCNLDRTIAAIRARFGELARASKLSHKSNKSSKPKVSRFQLASQYASRYVHNGNSTDENNPTVSKSSAHVQTDGNKVDYDSDVELEEPPKKRRRLNRKRSK